MSGEMPFKFAYTATEAVQYLPWGRTKVNEMIASGEIPSRFKHGRRYIMRDDLIAVLESEPVTLPDVATPTARVA